MKKEKKKKNQKYLRITMKKKIKKAHILCISENTF